MAHEYQVGRSILSTDLEFPDLPRATLAHTTPAMVLTQNPGLPPPLKWSHVWRSDDGTPLGRVTRFCGQHWLDFPGVGTFSLSESGSSIGVYADEDAKIERLRHTVLHHVIPRAFFLGGHVALHASAVQVDGRGLVAFVGPSGHGKSTLAAALGLAGYPTMTDDCLVLQGPEFVKAHGLYPGSRLWSESRQVLGLSDDAPKEKLTLDLFPFSAVSRPVFGCVILDGDDDAKEVEFRPIPPAELAVEIFRHSFQLDPKDRDLAAAHFIRTSQCAERLRGWTLRYPWDIRSLHSTAVEVARGLQRLLQGGENVCTSPGPIESLGTPY